MRVSIQLITNEQEKQVIQSIINTIGNTNWLMFFSGIAVMNVACVACMIKLGVRAYRSTH